MFLHNCGCFQRRKIAFSYGSAISIYAKRFSISGFSYTIQYFWLPFEVFLQDFNFNIYFPFDRVPDFVTYAERLQRQPIMKVRNILFVPKVKIYYAKYNSLCFCLFNIEPVWTIKQNYSLCELSSETEFPRRDQYFGHQIHENSVTIFQRKTKWLHRMLYWI